MRALVERSGDPAMGFEVAAVLADRAGAAGLAIARDLGVPAQRRRRRTIDPNAPATTSSSPPLSSLMRRR